MYAGCVLSPGNQSRTYSKSSREEERGETKAGRQGRRAWKWGSPRRSRAKVLDPCRFVGNLVTQNARGVSGSTDLRLGRSR